MRKNILKASLHYIIRTYFSAASSVRQIILRASGKTALTSYRRILAGHDRHVDRESATVKAILSLCWPLPRFMKNDRFLPSSKQTDPGTRRWWQILPFIVCIGSSWRRGNIDKVRWKVRRPNGWKCINGRSTSIECYDFIEMEVDNTCKIIQ